MKRVLNFLLILIGLSVITIGVVYFIYPGVLLSAVQSMSASGAGLEHRKVEFDEQTVYYYEGGSNQKTTLVLLHGLGDDKNSFVTSVRQLTAEFRVILPDLPGHGDNAKLNDRDVSINGQTQFISTLLQKLNANRVFIGGHNLGGHIALNFAAQSSEKTEGLILINSGGLKGTSNRLYEPYPKQVDSQYFSAKFKKLFVTPPAYPKPVMQHMANTLNPNIGYLNHLIKQVSTSDDVDLTSVSAKSLIIWGKQDPLLAAQTANTFKQGINESKLIMIDNASHSPQFEMPDQVQVAIKEFIKQ